MSLSLSLLGDDVRGRATPFLGKQSSLCSYVWPQWQHVIQEETPRLAVFLCSERLPGTDLQTHHPDHSWTPWADPERQLFLVEFFCRFSYHALTVLLLKTASGWLSLPQISWPKTLPLKVPRKIYQPQGQGYPTQHIMQLIISTSNIHKEISLNAQMCNSLLENCHKKCKVLPYSNWVTMYSVTCPNITQPQEHFVT